MRLLSGIASGDVSDNDINSMITISDRATAQEVFEYHYNERLLGTIDGTNKQFQTDWLGLRKEQPEQSYARPNRSLLR